MNVKLGYDSSFNASVWYEGSLRNNMYSIHIDFITVSDDMLEHNIALDRVKYMLSVKFDSTVFLKDTETETISALTKLGIKTAPLPEEPIDQVIGIALYSKLNAVMEESMEITQLSISSELGEDIIYYHDDEDSLGPFAKAGWWSDPEITTAYKSKAQTKDKVVKINKDQNWSDVGLDWIGLDFEFNESSESSTVVTFEKQDK